jgi:hypothetical protein
MGDRESADSHVGAAFDSENAGGALISGAREKQGAEFGLGIVANGDIGCVAVCAPRVSEVGVAGR